VTACAPRPPPEPLGEGAGALVAGAALVVAGVVGVELLELEFELLLQPAAARVAATTAVAPKKPRLLRLRTLFPPTWVLVIENANGTPLIVR
jgi:hypothetical protein